MAKTSLPGMLDVDEITRQFEALKSPMKGILERHRNDLSALGIDGSYFRELAAENSAVNTARRAMEDLERHGRLFDSISGSGALSRAVEEAQRAADWMGMAELDRSFASITGNRAFDDLADRAREMSDARLSALGAHDAISEAQRGYSDFLEQARAFTDSAGAARLVAEEVSRIQRMADAATGAAQWEGLFPELYSSLQREQRRMDSMFGGLDVLGHQSFAQRLTDLQKLFESPLYDASSIARLAQQAVEQATRYQIDTLSPDLLRGVVNGLRWNELFERDTERPDQRERSLASGKRRRKRGLWWSRLTIEEQAYYWLVAGVLFQLIQLLFESGLLQRFGTHESAREPQIEYLPDEAVAWAITILPTSLFASPSSDANVTLAILPGTWLRVRESRGKWLLVDVETPERTRAQGWVRKLASTDLQDEIWTVGLRGLAATLSGEGDAPNPRDTSAIVTAAGPDAEYAFKVLQEQLKSTNTREAYQRAFTRFFAFCDQKNVSLTDVEPVHIRAYLAEVARSDAPATTKQHLMALRKLFDYLEAANLVSRNPAAQVKPPSISTATSASPVSGKDVERLLLSVAGEREAEVRDRAIIALIATLGLKVSELVSLTITSVTANSESVQLRVGSRSRTVTVPEPAASALRQYLDRRGDSNDPQAPLFVSSRNDGDASSVRGLSREEVYSALRRRAQGCQIEGLSCEGLRGALRSPP